MAGVCSAGLRITGLPATSAATVMPAGMASGKFHGAMTAVDALALVAQAVGLARRRLHQVGGRAVEAQHLAAVVLAEVDRLAHVGVGLVPRLAGLEAPRARRARRAGPASTSAARNSTRGPLGGRGAPPRVGGGHGGRHRGVGLGRAARRRACATTRSGSAGVDRVDRGRRCARARRRSAPGTSMRSASTRPLDRRRRTRSRADAPPPLAHRLGLVRRRVGGVGGRRRATGRRRRRAAGRPRAARAARRGSRPRRSGGGRSDSFDVFSSSRRTR